MCKDCEVLDEPAVNVAESKKRAEFRSGLRGFRVSKRRGVSTVDLESTGFDHVAQVLHGVTEESAFLHFQSDPSLLQGCQDFVHMTNVLLHGFGVYDHIVDVDQTRFPFET